LIQTGNTGKLEMMIKQQDHKIVSLETSNHDQASEIADLKAKNLDLNERLAILEDRFNRVYTTKEATPDELLTKNKVEKLQNQQGKQELPKKSKNNESFQNVFQYHF